MEIQEITAEKSHTETKLKIYSKKTILVFSIIFGTIFGAFLLIENLKDLDKKKIANYVLIGSIAYTILSFVIMTSIEKRMFFIPFLFNLTGGVILTDKIFKKQIPYSDFFPNKKILKPLIISVIVSFTTIIVCIATYWYFENNNLI